MWSLDFEFDQTDQTSRTLTCNWSSGHGELGRIGQVIFGLLRLLQIHVGLDRDCDQVLQTVGNTVRYRRDRWVADLQTNSADVANALQELHTQVLRSDVQNLRCEDRARIVDLLNLQAVGERRDVQHVQQRGLRCTDLITGRDQ